MKKLESIEQLKSWAKENAFIYPSSEIYGGFAAVYDYGHNGMLLKNNIQASWLKSMIQMRNDVIGLDAGIFMHPTTWKASGHLDSFDDPQIDCRNCKNRFRADHLLENFGINADKWPINQINLELTKLREEDKLKCPVCGSKDLTDAKQFSLMVKTNMGSPTNELKDNDIVYLRPETCGAIYLNYKNYLDTLRVKLPFGVAQVGKAFRNEIVARQFIFRTREFEQMEMQYFLHPDIMQEKFEEWKEYRWRWYINELGINEENLKWHKHEKLAHYAKEAFDIEYNFTTLGGFKEVEGVHQRGDWDLKRHAEFSGTQLDYFNQLTGERFVPHIMETSVGLNRLVMLIIEEAWTEEEFTNSKGKDSRIVLKLKKEIAPIKIAILPLSKKPELQNKALEVQLLLKSYYMTQYDDTASIGKRYRRQDEIGTPYCITIDFETLSDNMVTIRDRDTMKQERIDITQIKEYFNKLFNF